MSRVVPRSPLDRSSTITDKCPSFCRRRTSRPQGVRDPAGSSAPAYLDADLPELRAVYPKNRPGGSVGVLEMWVAVWDMKEPLTFRERRALRRSRFDPDAFDLDSSDRSTLLICVVILALFVGGLWLLGR